MAGPTKITTHVLQVIGELYDIETTIRGKPAEERRQVRQEHSSPIVERLHDWLAEQLPTLSRKSVTADAIRYAMNQWQALTRYLDNGSIEMDNNHVHAASGMSRIMPRSGLCRLDLASRHSCSTYTDRLAA